MILLLIAVFAVFVFYVIQKKQYEKTEYYTQTKTPYFQMIFDKGRLGEFYTYKNLKTLKGSVYVNGDVTAPVCLQGEVTTLKCA